MNNNELTSKVREILLANWDPCGVGGNSALVNEYDDYLLKIVTLVVEGASSSVMNQTLFEFEKELGITLPKPQRERTVRTLLAISP